MSTTFFHKGRRLAISIYLYYTILVCLTIKIKEKQTMKFIYPAVFRKQENGSYHAWVLWGVRRHTGRRYWQCQRSGKELDHRRIGGRKPNIPVCLRYQRYRSGGRRYCEKYLREHPLLWRMGWVNAEITNRPFESIYQTFYEICFTRANFFHCSSSVNLFPISQEAKPHWGLR